MDADVKKDLVIHSELLMNIQKRLIEAELRIEALKIVLVQATGFDLKSAEESLEKIVDSLRDMKVDEANEEAAAIIELLRKGKDLNNSDA